MLRPKLDPVEANMDQHSRDLDESIQSAAGLVLKARHLVALVGAGMSVESGIPPFRGPGGGLWNDNREPASLSYHKFVDNPAAWWKQRLKDEREPGNPTYQLKVAVDKATPNEGHHSLVELESLGLLKSVITQNVDNLHREAGSANLLEIHGNRGKLRCLDCASRLLREELPMIEIPPRCPECGGVLKIDSVMFGEPIPPDVLRACLDQVERCDCMLVIGTSGTVRPAASLPLAAKERGATLVEINPHSTPLTPAAEVSVAGPSGEVLPLLVAKVKEGQNSA